MFYSVQQGSRYIWSLTNQRSWFEVRRLQHHQQIKAHGQHMVNTSILNKFLRPLGFSDDNSCTKAWYAPYWFLLAIQGLTHNLPKRFSLYWWIPAAFSKMQTGMIMSSLSGFSILAGRICKQTAWNMLLDLVCKLTRIMIQKVAWYKYRNTCFTV